MYTEYVFENREYDIALREVKAILFDIVMTEQAKVNAIISKVKTTGDVKLQEKLITLCNEQAECLRSLLDISNSFRENLQMLDSYSRELKRIENKNIANIITGMRSKNKRQQVAEQPEDAAVQEEMARQQQLLQEQQAAMQTQQEQMMMQEQQAAMQAQQEQMMREQQAAMQAQPQEQMIQEQQAAPEQPQEQPQPEQTAPEQQPEQPQPEQAPAEGNNPPAEELTQQQKDELASLGLKIPKGATSGVIKFNSTAKDEEAPQDGQEENKPAEDKPAEENAAPEQPQEQPQPEQAPAEGNNPPAEELTQQQKDELASLGLKIPEGTTSGVIKFNSTAKDEETAQDGQEENKPAEDKPAEENAAVENQSEDKPAEENATPENGEENTEEKSDETSEKENKSEENPEATAEQPAEDNKDGEAEENKEESNNTVVQIPTVTPAADSEDKKEESSEEKPEEENKDGEAEENKEESNNTVVQIPTVTPAADSEETKEETSEETPTENSEEPKAAEENKEESIEELVVEEPTQDTSPTGPIKFKKVSDDEVKAILTSAKQIEKLRESQSTQEALLNTKHFFDVSASAEVATQAEGESAPVAEVAPAATPEQAAVDPTQVQAADPNATAVNPDVPVIPAIPAIANPAQAVQPVADPTQAVQPVADPAQAVQPVVDQVTQIVQPAPVEGAQPAPVADANLENQLMNNGLLPQDPNAIQATINQKMEQAKQLYAAGQQEAAQALYNEISELSKNLPQPAQPAMAA